MDQAGRERLPVGCLIVLALLLPGTVACGERGDERSGIDRHTIRRHGMVEKLRVEGIRSQDVLNAMAAIPRHRFVPENYWSLAYEIRPLPIGHDQTISSPYIVAYMTEVAQIAAGDKVLEIGTGSGYQAAVLSALTDSVFSIEIVPELAETARQRLHDLGILTAGLKTGNGYLGWPEHAPFDAIVVTAAPAEVPQALVDQLAMHGRMVIPVGTSRQEMRVLTRTPQGIVSERTLPVRFVPMVSPPGRAP